MPILIWGCQIFYFSLIPHRNNAEDMPDSLILHFHNSPQKQDWGCQILCTSLDIVQEKNGCLKSTARHRASYPYVHFPDSPQKQGWGCQNYMDKSDNFTLAIESVLYSLNYRHKPNLNFACNNYAIAHILWISSHFLAEFRYVLEVWKMVFLLHVNY